MDSEIKQTVKKLIKKHRTDDPFKIAACLGINVELWPFAKEIHGLYQPVGNVKFIYIRASLPYSQKKLICTKGLAHAYLHKGIIPILKSQCSQDKIQTEANLFAIEMLMPDKKLKLYKNYTLQQVAKIEKIPYKLLKLKLQDAV